MSTCWKFFGGLTKKFIKAGLVRLFYVCDKTGHWMTEMVGTIFLPFLFILESGVKLSPTVKMGGIHHVVLMNEQNHVDSY